MQTFYNFYEPEGIRLPDRNFKCEFEIFTMKEFLNCTKLKDCENKLSIDAFIYFSTSQIQFQQKNKGNFQKGGKFEGKSFDTLNTRIRSRLMWYIQDYCHETKDILTEYHAKYFRNCYSFLLGKYGDKRMNRKIKDFDNLINDFIFNCDDATIDSIVHTLIDDEVDELLAKGSINEKTANECKVLYRADIFATFTLVIGWVNNAWKKIMKEEQKIKQEVQKRKQEEKEYHYTYKAPYLEKYQPYMTYDPVINRGKK